MFHFCPYSKKFKPNPPSSASPKVIGSCSPEVKALLQHLEPAWRCEVDLWETLRGPKKQATSESSNLMANLGKREFQTHKKQRLLFGNHFQDTHLPQPWISQFQGSFPRWLAWCLTALSGTKNAGTEPYVRRIFGGWVFPYISRIHTAYIGEDFLRFRYLKCLVKQWFTISEFPSSDFGW